MKKGKFKKLLLASTMGIMAMAMPFSLVGCDISSKEPAMTTEEAYSTLRELVAVYRVVNQDTTHESLINMGRNESVKFDFESSDLLPTSIATLQSRGMVDSGSKFSRAQEFHFDKGTNTGYGIDKVFDYENFTYNLRQLDVTKKVDNQFVNYFTDTSNEKAYLVDNKYAKNTYLFDRDDLNNYCPQMSAVLDGIVLSETFETYVEIDNDIAAKIISDSVNYEIDGELLDLTTNLTEKDGVYTLTVKLVGDDLLLESSETETTKGDINADFAISFNKNGIISSAADMIMEQNKEIKAQMYSLLLGEENPNMDANDIVKQNAVIDMNFSVDYDATLNDKNIIMNNDYDFSGTGVDGALVNRNPSITVCFVEANTDTTRTQNYNEIVDTALTYTGFDLNAVEIEGVYWDKDYTKPVQSTDRYPSYDATIYVKVKAADNYAVVQNDTRFHKNGIAYWYSYNYMGYMIDGSAEQTITIEAVSSEYGHEGDTLSKLIINGEEIEFTPGEDYVLTLEPGNIYIIDVRYSA